YRKLVNFAYEKYFYESLNGRVYLIGVIPEYDTMLESDGEDMVSHGIYFQWEDLSEEQVEQNAGDY
ncbi:MAG: hypothetical protein Q4B70_06135, partial [Lachnospiraceae bacterium]|nr:hypothetical protein [Lachnospiraceae bacterium]